MADIYEALIAIVGIPPEGYEVIAWVFSALVFIYFLYWLMQIFGSLINWLAGNR